LDKFVNLHTHSYYSLLDAMNDPKKIVDYTLKIGQPASCITDHGNLYSIIKHFSYAYEKKQKPIAGFEAYVVDNHLVKNKDEAKSESDVKRQHLLMLAKDYEGYQRLMKICSVGMTKGFYYRPRIDDNVLKEIGTKGIIGSSACFAGRIPQLLLKDNIEEAEKQAIFYYQLFNEDFYLELQPTQEINQVKVNKGLIELHKKLGIPLIATSDAHYLLESNAIDHEILLAVQSKSSINNEKRWKFPGNTFFVMTREEMQNAFLHFGHETLDQNVIAEALDNTVLVAEQCNVEMELGKHYLPKFDIPKDDKFNNWVEKNSKEITSGNFLRYLCISGLKNKNKTSAEYRERLDYELGIIEQMGFSDYFLIIWDIMNYAYKEQIATGPGRGCHVKNSIVKLANGERKYIQDIVIGDIVIGHDEIPNKVIKTLKYDCNEEIVNLTCGDKTINCTKDHETFAIKKNDWDNGIREPKWYPADELNEGDCIAELHKNFKVITKKEYQTYAGNVYDLTVENSHSYNIDGLITHNSCGGSLIAYACGITRVDPLKHDLLFERFINPNRKNLPDIFSN